MRCASGVWLSAIAFKLLLDLACFFDQFLGGDAVAADSRLQFQVVQFEELFEWIHVAPPLTKP